jgi:hypothetical protein
MHAALHSTAVNTINASSKNSPQHSYTHSSAPRAEQSAHLVDAIQLSGAQALAILRILQPSRGADRTGLEVLTHGAAARAHSQELPCNVGNKGKL